MISEPRYRAGDAAATVLHRQPGPWRLDLAVALLGLLVLVLWEASGFDLTLSRLYGTQAGFPWRDAWLTRALLHDGGRAVAWCVAALMVGAALWPANDEPARKQRWYWVGVSVLCLLIVPTIKRITDISCPWDLAEFGGVAAYVPHWRVGVSDGGSGHCFPSGHAVAAFAFLSLYFGWRTHRPRLARLTLVLVCGAGALFGWAQLARGAHYVSHTLWSAWFCWLLCALAANRLARRRPGLVVAGSEQARDRLPDGSREGAWL
jgi:membrane-associated PAP2 superfamily phosphatase